MRYSSSRRRHREVRACAPRGMAARTLVSHPSRHAEDGSRLRMTDSLVEREDRRMSKSSTATSRSGLLLNPHPGAILLEEFLKPMGLSQNALARAVHVAPRRINEIVLGKRDVTADTDLRLAR